MREPGTIKVPGFVEGVKEALWVIGCENQLAVITRYGVLK